MKEILNNPSSISKLEFWAATTVFVFAIFLLITPAVDRDLASIWTPNRPFFNEFNIPYSYYRNYLIPQIIRYSTLYIAFLALNFVVAPALTEKRSVPKNVLLLVCLFAGMGLVLGTTDTYYKNYLFSQYETEQETYNSLFQKSFLYAFWLLLVFGFYCVVKYAAIYLLSHSDSIQARYKIITQDGLFAFVLWMVSLLLLVIGNAEGAVILAWSIAIPLAILLYCYSLYALIPQSLGKKHPFSAYMLKALLILIASVVPVFFVVLLITTEREAPIIYSTMNVPFQLLFTAPVSWMLFKYRMRGKEEIYTLKKELGQSHASFDFLRSQINPHFLFNALNTIYGTAIQEKAERTCEGIEKLGEMMRFMLQENMQDKISLTREIEYLNNYISLQKLRTDPNPGVNIESQIDAQGNGIQISPMLLIPFVENAFKHGISLREPSHIKILLEVKDKTLYFDVYNSKHGKQENDPEKNRSGIGLSNVKQRLQLLYPGKHELIIRETGKEFFVHLTIHFA